jgi:eukaryotic-like serine/threonine-protein kinase
MRLSHPAESIPFFEQAIKIYPTFASAYITLSRIYSTLGESERAREYAQQAYDQRDRVVERDRLSITYQYHYDVTGDQSLAMRTLEAWKLAFPAEFEPVNSLAHAHNFLGRFDLAIEEGLEAVRRNPSHGYPYSNLAHAYRAVGRFDEARAIAERAVALEIETLPTRRLLYQLAVLAGDEEAARRHVDWARDKPREFDIVGARAQVTAWAGRVSEARLLYEDAVRMAELRNLTDVGTSYIAWEAWMEMAYGYTQRAVDQARRVVARNPSYDPRLRAALVLAMAGSTREARTIATALKKANPQHTFINSILLPIVNGGIELGRSLPTPAIEQLRIAAPYELGFIAALTPIYLRGQAYVMLGSAELAIQQFQRIFDHRGCEPFSPFHAVAPLGVARAKLMGGDRSGSLDEYERFLSLWAGADPEVPVLRAARAEHSQLKMKHKKSMVTKSAPRRN